MDSLIKKFPVALIVVYMVRSMFLGPQMVDIGILAVLGAIYAYCEFKTEQKIIKNLQNDLDSLKNKQKEMDQVTSDLKTHVAGMKIGLNIKSTNMQQKF